MNMDITSKKDLPSFFSGNDLHIEGLQAECERQVCLENYPNADSVEQNILIYQGDVLRAGLKDSTKEAVLTDELCRCLRDGPGVFVIKNAYEDPSHVDRMTKVFEALIQKEQLEGQGKGDHFGTNERIWNSIQKACGLDPDLCVDYYGNPLLALAARAWLGPGYQVTAQVNNVKPGGKAQAVHRDYHLGFQSDTVSRQFPVHSQMASQYLTLQGAIAHTDMPLESGPTLVLPFSHHFPAGYLSYRLPAFVDYFEKHRSQLPLNRGDMLYFSPAVFHAAGENRTQNDRLANLVQISSAFGRAMEEVNRFSMVEQIHPHLLKRLQAGGISDRQLQDVVSAFADGYSFPTNLDSDPPLEGCAPETSQQLWLRALKELWPVQKLTQELTKKRAHRRA
jgi:ectoine hydroxylase-related dioxygenase (phytanoyl-CoA dioxygenase family)